MPGIGREGHKPGTDSRTGRILFGFRHTMEAVIHGTAQFLLLSIFLVFVSRLGCFCFCVVFLQQLPAFGLLGSFLAFAALAAENLSYAARVTRISTLSATRMTR